ncbi:MAG: caspase family protein [Thermodesulfobacteriota bacterium]|nr:caspase family protein [Thermodesulfobacteriota bacterium]
MKPKHIFSVMLIGVCAFLCLPMSVQCGQTSKILILVRGEQPLVQSVGTGGGAEVKIVYGEEGGGAKTAEMLLAKRLLGADYDVLTSDDLSASSWLTSEDIAEAKKGNVPKGRKAAASNDANVLFSGFIKVGTSSEEVLGMKMNKAVTTLSYKLVNTASGKVLDLDSRHYRSSSRSAKEAVQATLETMATELSQELAKKVPREVSKKGLGLLTKYKKTFEKTKVATRPSVPLEPKASKEKAQPAPQIVIISPPVGRGFEVVEKDNKVTIEGLAKDPAGIKLVKVNADPADLDEEGFFSYEATLSPGDNRYLVLAMNKVGNTATKELVIKHKEDEAPPEIVLMRPQVTRGFTVVFKEPVSKTVVEGLVKDDTSVRYVRVNGADASLDNEGYFSEEVPLKEGDDRIVIVAADKSGNQTRKEFRITRSYEGTRVVGALREEALTSGRAVKPALWGLAIGVSRYDGTPVDLKYADDDAKSLALFFKEQEKKMFSEVHFETLVNEDVTRDSIIRSISRHLGKAAPDDVVFIFIAGHGMKHRQSGSYYFVPYDANFDSILSKGLRMSDFEEAVNILSRNVNKVIIAMDTCHSGAMRLGARAHGSGEDLAEALREASGLFVLAASKGGEESLEDEKFKVHKEDAGHGAFTYALLEGMSGKANYDGDHYISLNELFQYVAKQVPRITDGRQHPYFRSEGTDMPLIFLKK